MGKRARTRQGRTPITRASRRAATTGNHVVYVHGICQHEAGFSDPWWAALRPHIPSVPASHRHEVLWSDLVTRTVAARATEAILESVPIRRELSDTIPNPEQVELAVAIQDVLQDRAEREIVQATVATAGDERLFAEAVAPVTALSIPGVNCIDDFVIYLTNPSIREEVIDRFRTVVRPLLAAGSTVEIISHSWGTVVAYEALVMLESEFRGAQGVRNLFTVGSALSIGPVKRRLIPSARDGHRPSLVRRWINLDAKHDVVGGPLQGNPFAVDHEFLNLAPVGCSRIIPNPRCAHSSYFHPDNLVVNRDIFGHHIEPAID
jgi:hypothetical protein